MHAAVDGGGPGEGVDAGEGEGAGIVFGEGAGAGGDGAGDRGVAGAVGGITVVETYGLLQPGEVQTIVIETPYNAKMKQNNYNFSHANGTIKPHKVAKMGDEKEPAAKPASATKPAAKKKHEPKKETKKRAKPVEPAPPAYLKEEEDERKSFRKRKGGFFRRLFGSSWSE